MLNKWIVLVMLIVILIGYIFISGGKITGLLTEMKLTQEKYLPISKESSSTISLLENLQPLLSSIDNHDPQISEECEKQLQELFSESEIPQFPTHMTQEEINQRLDMLGAFMSKEEEEKEVELLSDNDKKPNKSVPIITEDQKMTEFFNRRLEIFSERYKAHEEILDAWSILEDCFITSPVCNNQMVEEITSKFDDVKIWMYAARYYIWTKQLKLSIKALKKAANAPTYFDGYKNKFIRDLKLYSELFPTLDKTSFFNSLRIGFSMVGHHEVSFEIRYHCRDNPSDNLCLDVGQRLIHVSESLDAQIVGYKLLTSYYSEQNQIELKEQMQTNIKELQALLKQERLPILDEEFIDYYLTSLENNNQEDFIRLINAES